MEKCIFDVKNGITVLPSGKKIIDSACTCAGETSIKGNGSGIAFSPGYKNLSLVLPEGCVRKWRGAKKVDLDWNGIGSKTRRPSRRYQHGTTTSPSFPT